MATGEWVGGSSWAGGCLRSRRRAMAWKWWVVVVMWKLCLETVPV